MRTEDKDLFIKGYLICALWSTLDDKGNPLEQRFQIDDIDPDSRTNMEADCATFIKANETPLAKYLEKYPADYAGHDFWLTRNGHGAGYWDRSLPILGELLTGAAQAFNSQDLDVGDDGKLYVA